MRKFQLDRLQPESEQDSDSQITISGPGPGFQNFGTVAESESEKVTSTMSSTVLPQPPALNHWEFLLAYAQQWCTDMEILQS